MKTRRGYLFRRGKTYYACWFVSGKKFVKSTGQTDRRDAETELSRIIQPFLVQDEVRTLETMKARIEGAKNELAAMEDKRNPPLALADAWKAYLKAPNRPDSGERTLEQYCAETRRFVAWMHGRKAARGLKEMKAHHSEIQTMQAVTEKHATEYASHLLDSGTSSSTFNQHVSFLRLLWKALAKPAKTTTNPWENLELRRLKSNSRRELTIEELERVCRSAKGEMRTLFALGIYSGLRRSDCATLQWGEVDLRRNRITRVPDKTARRRARPVVIPIHPVLKDILNETPPDKRTGHVLPELAKMYRSAPDTLNRMIQAHFAANEIRTIKEGTGEDTNKRAVVEVGFHSLRHTFVSLCREANAPLAVVEAIVGHSNPAMTRHYTHVSELAAGQAVNALPSIVGKDSRKALPAPRMMDVTPIVSVVKSINAKNWRATKEELLAALSG